MIRNLIIDALSKASEAKKEEISLEFPENEAFGDYSSNFALGHKPPRKYAEDLVKKLKADKKLSEAVDKIEIAGPGFINFWLKSEILLQNLGEIEREKDKYGSSGIGAGKTVVIDYSSPNIAKPFGIGHLRSTIIGQALYNLYGALGYKVIGDNHLGDWGTQFGKLIYMIKKEKVKGLNIDELENLYKKFHRLVEDPAKASEMEFEARAWFKKLEDGDSEAKKIWQACVDVSTKEFDRIYKLLGVKVDYAYGEASYEAEMREMQREKTVRDRLTRGEDNAWIIDLARAGVKVPLMFLKSDGATTYATRDLATIRFRVRKWHPDLIIYEVGAEQTLHFQQVFAAARLLGIIDNTVKLVHTAHGLYLAPSGKKFSTRKGETIKLEDVLDEAIKRAKKLGNSNELTARAVGIGAIKYFDLMHAVKSDVVFDWEKIMNLEGNSGPYLQYTVARCNSVLSKSNERVSEYENKMEDDKWQMENEEVLVLRGLIKFPVVIEAAAKSFSPNLLCNFLYDLASKYNTFYNSNRIIGSENEALRLSLTFGVGQVLKNGLKILGIETPEKM